MQKERPAYKMVKPKTSTVAIDNSGRIYEPLHPVSRPNPRNIYTDIGLRESNWEIDIQELMAQPKKVLGRGSLRLTVLLNEHLVMKTTLFTEMANWGVPFMEDEGY